MYARYAQKTRPHLVEVEGQWEQYVAHAVPGIVLKLITCRYCTEIGLGDPQKLFGSVSVAVSSL